MSRSVLTREQVLIMLPETPPRIAALTADVLPEQVRATPTDGGWSANEVLAHLRACADVWGDCIVRSCLTCRVRCHLSGLLQRTLCA